MIRRLVFVPIALALLALPASAVPTKAKLDKAHSKIGFMSYTSLFDAEGKFSSYRASGKIDPDAMEKSQIKITVDLSSVDTDNSTRDDHLRTEDFFYVEKFPQATFVSKSITKGKKPNAYTLKGDLTIRGVKKTVSLPVEITTNEMKGKKIVRVKGAFRVNRRTFGIVYEGGMLMPSIKDPVDITFDLNFPQG